MPKVIHERGQRRGFVHRCSVSDRKLVTEVQIGSAFDPLSEEKATLFPEEFTALWDTGSTSSAIRNDVAIKFGLPVIGPVESSGVNGKFRTNLYLASLVLPNNIPVPEISLLGCNVNASFSIIIGMDIISQGDFLTSQNAGTLLFSFQIPSVRPMTLYQINKVMKSCKSLPSLIPVRPEVTRKPQIGRNDPCHCGSGKKFKQCCGTTHIS
jgi:hypothetical protein